MSAGTAISADAIELVAAGNHLAEVALLPSIRVNMPQLQHNQRAQLYAGLLGAVLGYMTADLGADDAEKVFLGFSASFDEIRADQIAAARGLN